MSAIPHSVDLPVKPDVTADAIIGHIRDRGLTLEWLIETHDG